MSKKREFPILNGKLISDLDANGFKILGADIEVPAEKIKEAVAPDLEAKADKTALAAETQRAQEAEAALREAVDGKADASSLAPVATSGNYDDLRGKPGNVSAFANDAGYLTSHQSWNDVKPSGGITASDLAAAVQTSLGKADTALQAHQDISGKADKVANATAGNLATLDENGNLVDSGNRVAGAFAADSFVGGGNGMVGFELDSTTKWVELYIDLHGGVILKFPLHGDTLAVQEDIAPTFDETGTYDEGALVFHDGLYQCINPNGHTGAWVAANFAEATVEDLLAALRQAVDGKVDAEAGKGLSSNDYTNEDKAKLTGIEAGAQKNPDLSGYATTDEVIPRKVEGYWETIVDGMGLHLLRAIGTDSASFTPEGVSVGGTAYQDGKIYYNGQYLSLPSVSKDETFAVKSDVSNAYSPDNPPPAPDLSGYATKSEIPYSLIEVPLMDRINLTDRAVNKVTADGSLNSIQFVFPEKKEGKSRDFFLRLVITGETVPTLSFNEPNGDSVSFDVDDDSWADIEQGVNILMFTDTEE